MNRGGAGDTASTLSRASAQAGLAACPGYRREPGAPSQTDIHQRFHPQSVRTGDLEAEMNRRFDRLTDDVSALRERATRISDRISRNKGRIDVVREQIQDADNPAPWTRHKLL